MRRTSSATLEFREDTLVMLSFYFLFTRKPTPACPLFAIRVVQGEMDDDKKFDDHNFRSS